LEREFPKSLRFFGPREKYCPQVGKVPNAGNIQYPGIMGRRFLNTPILRGNFPQIPQEE